MIKVFIAPRRYVQGVGVLKEIGKYVAPLGKRALVAWGPNVSQAFGDLIGKSFAEHKVELISYVFSGECDRPQVAAGIEKVKAEGADVVVGLGGGKAIDLGKAIAMGAGVKFASVPTIASNDAPTSAATVYYTCEGDFEGWDIWPANPDLVLVDTEVIVNADARWLVSGMGDGLCTWYEAEAAFKGRRTALAGGVATMAAMNLAKLCGETIFEFGVDAKRDCELHVVTPAVEKIVEANTLLSGLGFESGGVATAHAIGNGLTSVAKAFSHGERVAFGLAAQLCMDERHPGGRAAARGGLHGRRGTAGHVRGVGHRRHQPGAVDGAGGRVRRSRLHRAQSCLHRDAVRHFQRDGGRGRAGPRTAGVGGEVRRIGDGVSR